MQIDIGTLAIALAALSFLGAIGCIIALGRTRRVLKIQQKEVSTQLARLDEKVSKLLPAAVPHLVHTKAASVDPTEAQDELLAAVTAAAAAIAERKMRIRSLTQVPTESEAATAWSQQGRVLVQSSHNIGPHR
jgi:hypothetical protein